MANRKDIIAATEGIRGVWDNPPARNQLYGNVLRSLVVQNVRGLSANFEFRWPVTAIAGVNGSGKTTVLQLCSAAYESDKGGRHYALGSWIRGALIGETPAIQIPAKVEYGFWDTTPTVVVDYQAERSRWNYPRRGGPKRFVRFIGITDFAPRNERRDRLYAYRARLEVKDTDNADARVTETVSRILGKTYTDLKFQKVGIAGNEWTDEVPQLARAGTNYTESHMGAGEQKIVRLVRALESVPRRSLILLEEPELTLHPDAQMGLAWYLLALSKRQGHQILIATHSAELFEALPTEARILIMRTDASVETLHEVPHLHAARALAGQAAYGHDVLIVEDDAARAFLGEVMRQCDAALGRSVRIVPVGNDDDVRRVTKAMRDAGIRALGVLDGDRAGALLHGILALPGGAAPEVVLLSDANVGAAEALLAGISEAHERAKSQGIGHTESEQAKRVLVALAAEMGVGEEMVVERLTIAWLIHNRAAGVKLTTDIRKCLSPVGTPASVTRPNAAAVP